MLMDVKWCWWEFPFQTVQLVGYTHSRKPKKNLEMLSHIELFVSRRLLKNIWNTIAIHNDWVNYSNLLTQNKANWGWFPLLTMIPVRSQWGHYNLPRKIVWKKILLQLNETGSLPDQTVQSWGVCGSGAMSTNMWYVTCVLDQIHGVSTHFSSAVSCNFQ